MIYYDYRKKKNVSLHDEGTRRFCTPSRDTLSKRLVALCGRLSHGDAQKNRFIPHIIHINSVKSICVIVTVKS